MSNLFSPLIKIYKALYLFAYDITGNYGIALVLLSLFTFIILYPFNKKVQEIQQKEHKIQAVLSPQIEEIKKQYSGREQYENLQWLYQRYGYHPLYAVRSALGFILQIPFLTAAYYMLSGLAEIQGVSWGVIPNLGGPDGLLGGINLLPFVMTLVTVLYAFVMPEISKKERMQTVGIGVFFLVLLYSAPSALLVFWTCNLVWSLLDSVLSEKLQWLGDIISENGLALHIIFALALTIGIFVPLEIYINNASQLWFNLKDVLAYFVMDTVKYIGILFMVYIICWREKVRYAYLSILLGLLFGVFLQSYVIGLNYGIFDGHEIKWEEYTWQGVINTFIWLICLGGTFMVFYRLKFNGNKIQRFIRIVSFWIMVMQCVVLLFALVKNPIQKDIIFDDGKAGILTTKSIYTISAKENIIVFLLDMFDDSVFEEIMNKNPEVLEDLKDFTYYPDTTSSFGFTQYSLPEILTGKLFDPRNQYSDYIAKAWKNNPYHKVLLDSNYSINLYTSGNCVDKTAVINNLVTEKINLDENTVKSFSSLVKFRIVPHSLKHRFYSYQAEMQSPTVFNSNIKPYRADDRRFFIGLKEGLKITDKENAFRFYHLVGMHYPYILNENAEPLKTGETGTEYKQALGALRIVREFISQMKHLGVYHNAAFVVLADHRYHNMIGGRPIFLVKRFKEEHDKMTIKNEPKTVSQLMPMLLNNFKKEEEDKTFSNNVKERFFHHERGYGHFIKYIIKSPAKDIKSWIALGEITRNTVIDHTYVVGNTIDFSCFGDSFNYKGDGWTEREETFGSFITGKTADLILHLVDINNNSNIENKKSNYIVKVKGSVFFNRKIYKGNIKLYANNHCIGDWFFKEGDTVAIGRILPEMIVEGQPLLLRFVIDKPEGTQGIDSLVFCVKEVQIVKE